MPVLRRACLVVKRSLNDVGPLYVGIQFLAQVERIIQLSDRCMIRLRRYIAAPDDATQTQRKSKDVVGICMHGSGGPRSLTKVIFRDLPRRCWQQCHEPRESVALPDESNPVLLAWDSWHWHDKSCAQGDASKCCWTHVPRRVQFPVRADA